eukprot:g2493.t1
MPQAYGAGKNALEAYAKLPEEAKPPRQPAHAGPASQIGIAIAQDAARCHPELWPKFTATWAREDECTACLTCGAKFGCCTSTKFCYRCGQAHCLACLSNKHAVSASKIYSSHPVPVCKFCFDYETKRDAFYATQLAVLQKGAVFLKYPNSIGMARHRIVRYSTKTRRIIWHGEHEAPKPDAFINLDDIVTITEGHNTPDFRKYGDKANEHLCFSVCAAHRSLDLQASSTPQLHTWRNALEALLLFEPRSTPQERRADEMRQHKEQEKAMAQEQSRQAQQQNRDSRRAKTENIRANGIQVLRSAAVFPDLRRNGCIFDRYTRTRRDKIPANFVTLMTPSGRLGRQLKPSTTDGRVPGGALQRPSGTVKINSSLTNSENPRSGEVPELNPAPTRPRMDDLVSALEGVQFVPDPAPGQPAPADPAPATGQPAPADPAPAPDQPAPADPAPNQPDPAPDQPAPADPAPGQPDPDPARGQPAPPPNPFEWSLYDTFPRESPIMPADRARDHYVVVRIDSSILEELETGDWEMRRRVLQIDETNFYDGSYHYNG